MTAINSVTSAAALTPAQQTGSIDAGQQAKRSDSTTKTAHQHHGHHHRASAPTPTPTPTSASTATSGQGSALDVIA